MATFFLMNSANIC